MSSHVDHTASTPPGLTTAGRLLVGLIVAALLVGGLQRLLPAGVVGTAGAVAARLLPGRAEVASSVPPRVSLPTGEPPALAPTAPGGVPARPLGGPATGAAPEVRFLIWAWNAQMGLLLANGGPRTTPASLMHHQQIDLVLTRQDDVAQMQAELVTFARAYARGESAPRAGAHFVAIMGDGAAAFLAGLNPQLARICQDCTAQIVGSAGFSYGEDKLMGPPAWRSNPQAARGSLVATVLRDGDWNIVVKWAADNGIPINPDERSFDPDAINFVNAETYVDAGEKYLAGYCEPRRHKRSGESVRACVDAVSSWTPVDVTIARRKGGLVNVVSTREYSFQMPNAIIGIKGWMQANRPTVERLLAAICAGGDQVKSSPAALARAAAIAAAVYHEESAAYWARYFTGVVETDVRGQRVELGGSRVNNLADNLHLFGLAPGADDLMTRTYTTFGDIVVRYYPEVIASYPPAAQVIDPSYLRTLQEQLPREAAAPAEVAHFEAAASVKQVVSSRPYQVQFRTASAEVLPAGERELERLLNDAAIAGGLAVQVIGHTDALGAFDANLRLSDARAWAVKEWLTRRSPVNFPEARLRVFARGPSEPVGDNRTEEGRALNRRVEIKLVVQM